MAQNSQESKFEIVFHNDESYLIKVSFESPQDVIAAPALVKAIRWNLEIGRIIMNIGTLCNIKDGNMIFPKLKGVSNEIRLAASTAAMYPGGFPQDAIKNELKIADSSRDAYLNWETKESSKYLSYDKSMKQVFISQEGIFWLGSELGRKGVEGFIEEKDGDSL